MFSIERYSCQVPKYLFKALHVAQPCLMSLHSHESKCPTIRTGYSISIKARRHVRDVAGALFHASACLQLSILGCDFPMGVVAGSDALPVSTMFLAVKPME